MKRSITYTALTLAAIAVFSCHAHAADARINPPKPVVNVNTATVAQLSYLPGVGQKTAAAIAQYRQEHGPFATVEQLDAVKRIGRKKLDTLAPYVTLTGATTATAKIKPGVTILPAKDGAK